MITQIDTHPPAYITTYTDDWERYQGVNEIFDPYLMVWSAREYLRMTDREGASYTILTRALWDIDLGRADWKAIRYKYAEIDSSGRRKKTVPLVKNDFFYD